MAAHRSTVLVFVLMAGVLTATAFAQDHSAHDSKSDRAGALIRAVRRATFRFKDVSVAEAEGYKLTFGCVTGPDAGAMGLHYVNFALVGAGALDPAHPGGGKS